MQVILLSSSEKKLWFKKKNETLFLKHLLKQLILHKLVEICSVLNLWIRFFFRSFLLL